MSNFTNFNTEILTALNVSAIMSLLDTYYDDVTNTLLPALWASNEIPEVFDAENQKSINFFRVTPINNTIEYGQSDYQASCRAKKEADSITIAAAVVNEINRKNYSGYTLKTSMSIAIPPEDETDNWNTPVTITILQR